eukprot:1480340-Pleurochrysis_carterae.AAC.5
MIVRTSESSTPHSAAVTVVAFVCERGGGAQQLEQLDLEQWDEHALALQEHGHVVMESVVAHYTHTDRAVPATLKTATTAVAISNIMAAAVILARRHSLVRLRHVDQIRRSYVDDHGATRHPERAHDGARARRARCAGQVRAVRCVQVGARPKSKHSVREVGMHQRGGPSHRRSDDEHFLVVARIRRDELPEILDASTWVVIVAIVTTSMARHSLVGVGSGLRAGPACRRARVVRIGGVGNIQRVELYTRGAACSERHRPLLHAGTLRRERDNQDRRSLARARKVALVVRGGKAVTQLRRDRGRRGAFVPTVADTNAGQLASFGEIEAVGTEAEIQQWEMTQDSVKKIGEPTERVALQPELSQFRQTSNGAWEVAELVALEVQLGKLRQLGEQRTVDAADPIAAEMKLAERACVRAQLGWHSAQLIERGQHSHQRCALCGRKRQLRLLIRF